MIMQTAISENGMTDEPGSILVNLMFKLGEFLVRLHDSVFEILIDIGRIFAGCLGLVTQLLQLIDALAYGFFIRGLL